MVYSKRILNVLTKIALIGEGKVYDNVEKKFIPSSSLFPKMKFEPLVLKENELLSLVSGSSVTLACSLEPFSRAEKILRTANKIYAISFEALVGNHSPFYHKIHECRNHDGQIKICEEIIKNITIDGVFDLL